MRSPFKALLTSAALLFAATAGAQQVRMLVQSSPLAGYNYHEAAKVAEVMRAGDALTLIREPGNPHDANAIRVEWQARKLGYIPRTQNVALAGAMDRGEAIAARISRLQAHRNPRLRVEFEVFVE